MNAESLTLWKDVAGIYTADPKLIENVTKIKKLSFREATELAYFGAKIIHPKTAKPLMQKNINLNIKSFLDYNETGSVVGDFKQKIEPNTPVYIVSPNQILLTIMTNDFDFVDEGLYEKTYNIFNQFKTKINLMQNSALTLTICFDYNHNNFNELILTLKNNFSIRYNENLTLITIRHYTEESIKSTIKSKKIYLEQKNRLNAFFLVE
jgi:aspartate kinase